MQESGENYLETLLVLHEQTGRVRSIDVAHALQVSKPSVTKAMNILKELGFVVSGQGGELLLTDVGKEKAQAVYERHTLLTEFLMCSLGVSFEVANRDACRMEHIISDEVFAQVKFFLAQ